MRLVVEGALARVLAFYGFEEVVRIDTLLGDILAVFPEASARLQAMKLRKRCAAGDAQNLAADVARLLGGEENVRRRQLGRLGRASDGGL